MSYNANYTVVTLADPIKLPDSNSSQSEATDTPAPDLDLIAVDEQGRIIGPHPKTGEYVNQIPGAASSGDRQHGMEWILLPEGINATFYVDTTDTTTLQTTNTLNTTPTTITTTHYGNHAQLKDGTVTNTTNTHHTLHPDPGTYTGVTGTTYTATAPPDMLQ